jgi:fucose 4-O-acetylase-like acetyltransferase
MFAEAVLVELGQTRNLGSAAERELSERIQSARGLACILLVSFHVIGNEPTTGLHVPQESGLNFFAHLFSYIRMPLFSFLSGFVYAYRPVRESQGLQLAASKLRRLMIPMITAVTATYVLTLLHERHSAEMPSSFGAALGQLLPLYVYPYKHFWFLQALFLVFLLLIGLESVRALASVPRYVGVLAAAAATFMLVPDLESSFFSITNATWILPFFLLGLGVNRYRGVFFSREMGVAVVLVLVLAMGYEGLRMSMDPVHAVHRRALIALAIGMSAAVCIARWLPNLKALRFIGYYSFGIYLYHAMFLNDVRRVTRSFHASTAWVLFPLQLAVGLAIPILVYTIAHRYRLTRLLVLGEWPSEWRSSRDRQRP